MPATPEQVAAMAAAGYVYRTKAHYFTHMTNYHAPFIDERGGGWVAVGRNFQADQVIFDDPLACVAHALLTAAENLP